MIRHIRFFLYPGFQLLDLSGPLAAFQFAAEAAYKKRVVTQRRWKCHELGELPAVRRHRAAEQLRADPHGAPQS